MSSLQTSAIRIVIAEDHALVRDGLKLLLADVMAQASFIDAFDAASLTQALRLMPAPHLALIDLNMPGMDRGGALREILLANGHVPAVVISALTGPDVARRCLALPSVQAFIPKGATAAQMRRALTSVLAGQRVGMVELEQVALQSAPSLSPRLEQIRAMLRRGMSNKAIAAELGIGEGTVKNYISEIFKVLNVSNRTQAAQFDGDAS